MTGRIPEDLGRRRFDLIVIGGGINGAGIARDAALRGLSVLLLEKTDLCGATSSWNSRLIHGGLRYLEHGEVGLVRESLRDREILLRTAPHLVRPLPLLIPIYRSQRRGPWLVRLGMIAYDLLSLDKSLPRHRMLSRQQTLAAEPGLDSEGLRGAALYYDAQAAFPERLVLENVLSAQDRGARVITYAEVQSLVTEDGRIRGVGFEDRLDGGFHEAYADAVINVAGPWVDRVLSASGRRFGTRIGGTKGTHVVVGPFPGAPRRALYTEAATDQRPYFTLPWNELYLIGTTDTRFDGDLDRLEPTDEEMDYLLAETNRVIPGAGLTREAVLYAYAGVRPLPYAAFDSAGAITRRHLIQDHAPELRGLWSVIGGKLTTYRHLAEQAVEKVGRAQGWDLPACPTRRQSLPGARADSLEQFGAAFSRDSGLPDAVAGRLLRLYGVRATRVLELVRADPDLARVFSPATGAIAAELLLAFREELAQTLTDALMRRTLVGLGAAAGLDAVDAAASLGCRYLGWSAERAAAEVEGFHSYIKRLRPAGYREGAPPR